MNILAEKRLTELKIFGAKTTQWLADVGIYTMSDIEELGAVETYRRLKAFYPDKVTLNALYGIHGALLGMTWNMVTPEMKADLKRQLAESE